MEVIQGTHKAPEFAPQDYISNMPNNVVTHILDRLPLQEAVRTSILSRKWRFKWTMLSQLLFDDYFYMYLTNTKRTTNYGSIVSKLLLHCEGVITKFIVYFEEESECYDIAQWILLLSRKRVEELVICILNGPQIKLPIDLYSCLELKHLNLDSSWCECDPPASFHGFPNLLRLEMFYVEFESEKLFEILTKCPVLEILNIGVCDCTNLKLVQIAKLTNLKILSLALCNTDNASPGSIFELVGSLPKLQELRLNFQDCKPFTEDDAGNRSPTTFPCLKAIKLSDIKLDSGIMFSFAFEMIRSSPSLQTLTLEIIAGGGDVDPPPAICYPHADYNTTRLLQLRSVVVSTRLKASENGIRLIQYLLASSPRLEKIVIRASILHSDEKLKFATRLLELGRASPNAKVHLY